MKLLIAILAAISLAGTWDFRFEDDKSIEQSQGLNFTANDVMCVPGCWDVTPRYYLKRGTGLYRRTFNVEHAYKDAVLEVDGMGLRGKFAIDGRDLGEYPYPYSKLEIPVGPLSKGEHEIFAALDNRFDWSTMKLARAYGSFYYYGGFYRGVKIVEKQPKIFVRTLDYRTGKIEVEIEGVRKYTRTIKDFKLWSPEEPNLTTIDVGGRKVTFGIRQVEAREGKVFLNGKPIFLKGVNHHDQCPVSGAAATESQWVTDLQLLKSIGGNFVRCPHYPQSERFLELCDRMGVLVWEESLGSGNGQTYKDKKQEEFKDQAFRSQHIWQTRNMVRQSFNHPSVIIFGFLNECASDQEIVKSLVDTLITTIKEQDSGRLVTFASCQWPKDICTDNVDIVAFNSYPGTIPMLPGNKEELKKKVQERFSAIVSHYRQRYPDKPIMVSESGVSAFYGLHDPAANVSSEEFQDEYLADIFETLWSNPDVTGFAIWQMTDSRTYSRNCWPYGAKISAGYSTAGIFNLQRQPKKSVETVKRYFGMKAVPSQL